MTIQSLLQSYNLTPVNPADAFPVCDVEVKDFASLGDSLANHEQLPLRLMYATDERASSQMYAVHAVFFVPESATYLTLRIQVPQNDPRYPSLTATVMAAHWYERLMHDQFGIVAEGHPDWRRLEHHENIPANTYPLRREFAWNTKLAHANEPYPMHVVQGDGVYEIPVGPIHAGIIEPGHFRFNVRGERILTLEGKLFFKHKGVEKLLEGKTPEEAMPYIEQVSGDTSVGHALAFVQAVEEISGIEIPERAAYIRSLWNELERVTMHIFDIANIGGNGTGLTFMGAQGFRILEKMRRLSEKVTGHRFWRNMIVVGGISKDLTDEELTMIEKTIADVAQDIRAVIAAGMASDGLMERLETTGVLKTEAAQAYGALGLPARASGVEYDVRHDLPYAAYAKLAPKVVTKKAGDVCARFEMRVDELEESFRLIRDCLAKMPSGSVRSSVKLAAGSAYGAAEGWRGEILDWVRLDARGRIERCVVRDPSFCNWALFGEIGPGNIVPDFPLCNKSLNLSYSGTDM